MAAPAAEAMRLQGGRCQDPEVSGEPPVLNTIAWFIQAALANEGIISMEDLATSWGSLERVCASARQSSASSPNLGTKTVHRRQRLHLFGSSANGAERGLQKDNRPYPNLKLLWSGFSPGLRNVNFSWSVTPARTLCPTVMESDVRCRREEGQDIYRHTGTQLQGVSC